MPCLGAISIPFVAQKSRAEKLDSENDMWLAGPDKHTSM